jgi:transposase InsO family protein
MMARYGIGQPVSRKEDNRFTTGHGSYIDDLTVPGQTHAILVRSPQAHAEVRAVDVTDTLKLALEASGCGSAEVVHKPRLLSDNGSSYIAGDLAVWLKRQGMDHVRGAPNHPQTQAKIERWHQTLKSSVPLHRPC